jgi:hypothetical protein
LKRFSNVVSFLVQSKWEDGSSRVTGTVMLFVEGGCWKAWAHNRDSGEGAFLSALTLEGLLKSLDAGLESGQLDWREDRKSGGKR